MMPHGAFIVHPALHFMPMRACRPAPTTWNFAPGLPKENALPKISGWDGGLPCPSFGGGFRCLRTTRIVSLYAVPASPSSFSVLVFHPLQSARWSIAPGEEPVRSRSRQDHRKQPASQFHLKKDHRAFPRGPHSGGLLLRRLLGWCGREPLASFAHLLSFKA